VPSDLSSVGSKERVGWIVLPLLFFQLALLSFQIENPSGTILFKAWTLKVQAPIMAACSATTRSLHNAWFGYIWLIGARKENEQLRLRVDKLTMLNRSYEQSLHENARLKRLTSMSANLSYGTIGARVIARTPNFLANIVYVDRGSNDGIAVDSPVLSSSGIIGRVLLVSEHQSQVQLITNADASMGGMLDQSRTPGVLKGTGDFYLELNYIGNAQAVVPGEVVVSSGLDKIFPKGVAIGTVVESRKGKNVFREIKVKPIVDLLHLEEVLILTNEPKPDKSFKKIDIPN
jgi:rod shape-determining protein MreC